MGAGPASPAGHYEQPHLRPYIPYRRSTAREWETEAIVHEVYRDSASLMEHAEHLGDELTAAVMATGTVVGELLGDPTPELRARIVHSDVALFTPWLSI